MQARDAARFCERCAGMISYQISLIATDQRGLSRRAPPSGGLATRRAARARACSRYPIPMSRSHRYRVSVGRSSLAAVPAKPTISLDGERSMPAAIPVEARTDLSSARLLPPAAARRPGTTAPLKKSDTAPQTRNLSAYGVSPESRCSRICSPKIWRKTREIRVRSQKN